MERESLGASMAIDTLGVTGLDRRGGEAGGSTSFVLILVVIQEN